MAAVALFFVLPYPAGAEAPDVCVQVNGNVLIFDVRPRIVRDRVMVPVRAIFENLGATVEWVQSEKKVVARRGWLTVEIPVGKPTATVNSSLSLTMDVPPIIVGDRVLVPLRFVAECLGARVEWEARTRTVYITQESESTALDKVNRSKTIFADASGDFRDPEVGSPPGGVYWFPPADLSRLTVASDGTSLYVKLQTNGAIPTDVVTVEGYNEVTALRLFVGLDTDGNRETAPARTGKDAIIVYEARFADKKQVVYYVTRDTRAAGRLIAGGMGDNRVVLGFYLSDLGIQPGSEIDVFAWSEAESGKWPRFSFDELPNRDQADRVTVKIPIQ